MNFDDIWIPPAKALFALFLAFALIVCMTVMVMQAGTAMPTRVDVNGVFFEIEQVDAIGPAAQGIVGWTECSTRRILVSRHANDKRQTLMHELSHATVCTDAVLGFLPFNLYFNSSDSAEHEGIYRFSAMWREMFRRNPALAAYLAGTD